METPARNQATVAQVQRLENATWSALANPNRDR